LRKALALERFEEGVYTLEREACGLIRTRGKTHPNGAKGKSDFAIGEGRGGAARDEIDRGEKKKF